MARIPKIGLSIRVEPALRAEIDRVAEVETMSISQCAAWLIRRGLSRYRADEEQARRLNERAQATGAES